MPILRATATATALALFALALPFDAVAKNKHGKGWKKKHGHPAWVHRVDRRARFEGDLAALVAARPRLPDGSRIVLNLPSRPAVRRAPAPRPALAALPADPVVAQRRASAVDSFLRRHPPLP